MDLEHDGVFLNAFMAYENSFDKEWAEIFGRRENPPTDECRIFNDKSLTFDQRKAQIEERRTIKRAQRPYRKRVAPKAFGERVTAEDSLRAKGFGVKLE
jgi:hypothetical protein